MQRFGWHAVVVICVLRGTFFPAAQRFGDQCVGKHEPRLRHVGDRQEHVLGFACGCILAAQPCGLALDALIVLRRR